MVDGPNSTPSFGQPSRSTLWCQECGRFQACSPVGAMRYARLGWPMCCGEVMSNLAARQSWAARSPAVSRRFEEEKPKEGRPGEGPPEAPIG